MKKWTEVHGTSMKNKKDISAAKGQGVDVVGRQHLPRAHSRVAAVSQDECCGWMDEIHFAPPKKP